MLRLDIYLTGELVKDFKQNMNVSAVNAVRVKNAKRVCEGRML